MNWKNKLNKRNRLLTWAAVLLICLVGSAGLIYAAAPANPYGQSSGTNSANYPKALYDYFFKTLVNNITDIPFDTPIFMAGHGEMLAGTANPKMTTHDEMIAVIKSLPTTFMRWDYVSTGTSYSNTSPYNVPEMNFTTPLVVFSNPPVFEPEDLHALGKPIFFMQGGVHANEPSNAESVLQMVKKLATDELNVLDRISVVVMPRYNTDGAWRFQRGTNMIRGRNNVDQNRDHTMFISPQTRIINTILNRYRPHMAVDPHEMGYTIAGGERYYPSGVLESGDYVTYTKRGPNNNATHSAMTADTAALYQYSLYNPIDLGNKFYNQPPEIHQRNAALLNYITDKLWTNHGIYSFPYAMSASTSWRDTTVKIISDDGNEYEYPGKRQYRVMAFDCIPDEGYGDGALGLKGTIELCAEVPAIQIHADGFKPRMYAHYAAIRYMMMYLAENADIFMTELPAAREWMANDRSDLVLWSVQHPRSRPHKALKLNAARDAVEEVVDYTIPYFFDNANNTPGLSVTRPYAYIIDGEITNNGDKINADLAAFRLAYSGIAVMRLTESMDLTVEINRVDDIGALNNQAGGGRTSSFPESYASGAFKSTPAMASWTPDLAGPYWLGGYDTESSFGIQSNRIREATKRTETRTFPAGTYVVPTQHISNLHASLMLEVLGKRNMGNSYYTTRNDAYGPTEQHLHKEHYFPVEVGGDFPAYRYMSEIGDLPLERVYTEQAFISNANFGMGYPVSAGTLTASGYTLPEGVSEIKFGYHFQAEGTSVAEEYPQATAVNLHLPKAYGETELDNWYLYNWSTDAFDAIPADLVKTSSTSGSKYAALSSPYISSGSEVIAIVADADDDGGNGGTPGGGGGSSGCNAGAGAMLLVLSLAFVTINRKR